MVASRETMLLSTASHLSAASVQCTTISEIQIAVRILNYKTAA